MILRCRYRGESPLERSHLVPEQVPDIGHLRRYAGVHIYISGCDTKGVAQISPALTTALGALSQHVKIIPMGDDEGGTCIVETPEEIIEIGRAHV